MENLETIKLNGCMRINQALENSIAKAAVRHSLKMSKLYIEAADIDTTKVNEGKAVLASLAL